MQVSARSYLTGGIAVLGAGAMALSPVQPITASPALSPVVTQSIGVSLAAAIDPITPIVTTIQSTISNTTTLISNWIASPFPIAQTMINNWLYYFTELPAIGTIVQQVIGSIPRALQAPLDPGTISDGSGIIPAGYGNGDNISDIPVTSASLGPVTLPLSPRTVYGFVTDELGAASPLIPVLNFLQTPLSGALLGLAGPLIAPFVALGNGITGAIAAIQASDVATAINDLINIPTNMINAFLNGGVNLDLTTALKAALPPSVRTIGLNLGGLLTTFTSTIASTDFPVGSVQVGGVALDALSISADVSFGPATVTVNDPGLPVGLIGSVVSGTRAIAGAINNVPTAAAGATRRAPAASRTAAAKPAGKARAAAARHAS